MKKILFLLLITLIFLGFGCNNQDEVVKQQQEKIDELENKIEMIISSSLIKEETTSSTQATTIKEEATSTIQTTTIMTTPVIKQIEKPAATIIVPAPVVPQQTSNQIDPQLKAESDRQAALLAEQQSYQDKQEKVADINRQIIALNAKYVADVAAANKLPVTLEMNYADLKKSQLTTQYNIDYAALEVQYQKVLHEYED